MDNNALRVVQSAISSQELTATSKVTKETFHFDFCQINWDSKNEVTDTVLIMPCANSCVTASVQYSTIDFHNATSHNP